MFRKRAKRMSRRADTTPKYNMVPEAELFSAIGYEPELV